MSMKIDPLFPNSLKSYGKSEWNECFHCGNCTAICPLSEDGFLFPRKGIRTIQMGLKNKLKGYIEPWLCYYCGECSDTCPRNANPGELMMTLRRYLTKIYDWTGLSGILYTSLPALIISLIIVALAIIGVGYYQGFNLETFMEFGHGFEKLAILFVFSLILVPNIFRMFWFSIVKEKVKAPLISYVKGVGELVVHMFSQKNTLKCEENIFRWFEHFFVVIGYILLLITTVFLNWFNTGNTIVIWLGYTVGAITFIFTFDFIIDRIRKKKEVSKFSHPTDWVFVIWLFLMGLTAFNVRLFIDFNIIQNHYWLYMFHLIILAQWALLIVPFGKWTHFLYRSFAIYFAGLKKAAEAKQANKQHIIKAA